MNPLVLVLLAVAWAAVLLPPWLRGRSEGGSNDSIHSFRRQLSVLERRSPVRHLPPAPFGTGSLGRRPAISLTASRGITIHEARRRRRLILGTLALLVATSAYAAVSIGGVALYVNLFFDACFLSYVALLFRARQVAIERELKVRYLPGGPAEDRGEPVLLRSVR